MNSTAIRTISITVLCAVLVVACVGNNITTTLMQGSGHVITESRNVSGFNSLVLNGGGTLLVERTGTETLSITADDNILPVIEVRQQGSQLVIGPKQGVGFSKVTQLSFKLTVKDLTSLELNGGMIGEIKGVDTSRWQVTLNGGAILKTSGKATQQEITMNGASDYNAESFESQRAMVSSGGAGHAVVRVSDELTVNINGAGAVEYIGSPKVNKSINGIGTVTQRQ